MQNVIARNTGKECGMEFRSNLPFLQLTDCFAPLHSARNDDYNTVIARNHKEGSGKAFQSDLPFLSFNRLLRSQ
jgi:hypothetical protein